jgi:kynurenine formamidase
LTRCHQSILARVFTRNTAVLGQAAIRRLAAQEVRAVAVDRLVVVRLSQIRANPVEHMLRLIFAAPEAVAHRR